MYCHEVQIWILSFPMVLVGTGLVGAAGYYILPYQTEEPDNFGDNFGIWAWITLGAILGKLD